MTTNDIDARTIAAGIMTGNARFVTDAEIWAHIGQAYDDVEPTSALVNEVTELIAKAGIDLIWPDGMKDTELGAARVEIERLRAELDDLRMQVYAQKPVIDAAEAWAELHEESDVRLIRRRSAAPAVANLFDAVEQYRLMDLALSTAREQGAQADLAAERARTQETHQ